MDTMEIGRKLVDLCRQGRNLEAVDSLLSDDVVSVEAAAMPNMDREMRGREAVKGKNQWWLDNHDVHAAAITGPWPHGERFIVGFEYDVTNKPSGRRMQMSEMGLYTVKDGRIVREEFFYDMGG